MPADVSARDQSTSFRGSVPSFLPSKKFEALDLGGTRSLVDLSSGEVLGSIRHTHRLAPGPEGRARKDKELTGHGSGTPKKVSGLRKCALVDRAEMRTSLGHRLGVVRGRLVEDGYLVEDASGVWTFRDLAEGEHEPDGVMRLKRLYGWLGKAHQEVGKCCTRAHGDHLLIQESKDGGHFSGLIHCDRAVCKVCIASKAQKWREDLLEVLDQIPEDAQVVLKVFTARHRLGTLLADAERRQREALTALHGHRRTKKASYGHHQGLEITHSNRNGWHPHRNVLMAYRPDVDLGEQRVFEEEFYEAKLRELGGTVDFSQQADWFRVVDRTELRKVVYYLTKGDSEHDEETETVVDQEVVDILADSLTHELTGGHRKRGHGIPVQRLTDPDAYAEAWSLKGITWVSRAGCFLPSKGEADEAEDAALEREKTGITVAWLDSRAWSRMGQDSRDALARLVYAERVDPEAVMRFLSASSVLPGWYGLGSPPEGKAAKDSPPNDDGIEGDALDG